MNHKLTVVAIAGLISWSGTVRVAHAQGPCSLQTIAGTYALAHRGSSVSFNVSPQPFPPMWIGAAIAPFATVGEVTFTADGVGHGFYWMWLGSIRGTLDPPGLDPRTVDLTELAPPNPVDLNITEMKEDCTGKLQYVVPGAPPTTITERFIVFDEGREIRSLPTSIVNGVSTMAWIGTAHRISKGSVPVDSCGPQTTYGNYLYTCENIVSHQALYPTTPVSDALMVRADVSMTGDYSGTLYEKLGAYTVERPAWGSFIVNPDCSFTGTLRLSETTGRGIVQKGVLFNEGKDGYGLGLWTADKAADQQGVKYSFCQLTRIGPQPDR